jgi:hypothetical protein
MSAFDPKRILNWSTFRGEFQGTIKALQEGASIAGLLITTEAMVAEKPKKETPMPAMPPGGGMDYRLSIVRQDD